MRRGAVIASSVVLAAASRTAAQDAPLQAPTVGAGLRASFVHTDPGERDSSSDRFLLDSARLYVSGPVSSKVSYTFNAGSNGATNDVGVMDAVAQFAFSRQVNVWVGRFLPPSDRANLYGPFYANHWGSSRTACRTVIHSYSRGATTAPCPGGQFGKVKVSGGAFDGASATGDDTLIGAGRIQIDLWDPEPGYYQNGTFYGDRTSSRSAVPGRCRGKTGPPGASTS